MEYVDGVSLQRYVDVGPPQGGPVGLSAACEIVRQAALGLQHAHEHQLVHRDIKPANLMLARDGQLKILDMGLAKFHADHSCRAVPGRGDDGPADRLTQPGATMGTVDYMAPEQWENSASADIRADIYSLGCTLFFLLTGKPPYGGPTYDTSRKKLMAHAVAPIPSLRENCADVPEELEEVYETMMAKNPQDRYASPTEVAEAVAEFADAEDLAEVVAALPPHEVCVAAENTGVHGPGEITPPRHDPASAGSPPASGYPRRRSRSRWASRQKFRRNVTIGIAAGLTAAVGSVLLWSAIRPHGHGRAADGPPKPSASSASPGKSPSRESLAADLALLPGLNGRWWFDEMPWLTPFVRQAIAEKLLDSTDLNSIVGVRSQGYLTANTGKARQWLWDVGLRCRDKLSPCQQTLTDQLKALWDDSSGSADRDAQSFQNAVQQFADAHRDGNWSAADLHTVAVFQHAIAAASRDPVMVQRAKDSYDKALKAYRQPTKGRYSVEPLCLVDSAIFCEDLLDDIKDARQRLDAALGEKDPPVLFHVSALVQRGRLAAEVATSPGEFEDHRFVYAKKLLERYDAIKPVHPLAAYIAESYAASLLDQWKVGDASEQFKLAYNIRWIDQQDKDPSAAIYVFRDRLGSAVANRFRGNIDSARRSCKTLFGEIHKAINDAEHGRKLDLPPSDFQALYDQLANTLEAWGDCELYGGAAGNGKVNLAQAADSYELAGKMAGNPASAVVRRYKQAIVHAARRATHGQRRAARSWTAARHHGGA